MKNYIMNTTQYLAALKLMKAHGWELDVVSGAALWCYVELDEQQVTALKNNGFSVREA